MKINKKTAISAATTAGSAVVGVKISKAGNTFVPATMKNPVGHGALAILTIVAASMISGNSIGAQVGRGLAIGVGIDQANEAVNKVVAPMLPEADPASKITTAARAMVGLPSATGLEGYRGLKSAYSPAVLNSFENHTEEKVKINLSA